MNELDGYSMLSEMALFVHHLVPNIAITIYISRRLCNKNMYRQYISIMFSQKPEKSPVQPLLFPEIWILSCFNNQFYTARDDAASDCHLSTTTTEWQWMTHGQAGATPARAHTCSRTCQLFTDTIFARSRIAARLYTPAIVGDSFRSMSPVVLPRCQSLWPALLVSGTSSLLNYRRSLCVNGQTGRCRGRRACVHHVLSMTWHTRLTAGRSNTVECCTSSCVSVSGWWAWLLLV